MRERRIQKKPLFFSAAKKYYLVAVEKDLVKPLRKREAWRGVFLFYAPPVVSQLY